ncbi:NACHT domain-containing protein [Fusarium sp. LHS14.1]|nr:NACHT domain-containing protein [Fusarium sp. LHS14.1]
MDPGRPTSGGNKAYGTNANYNGHLHQGDVYGSVHHHHYQSGLVSQWLTDLPSIDPRSHKRGIERENRAPIKEVDSWILDTKQYRQWQHSEDTRLLWIEGNLGTGKTMLLCGIIDGLDRPSLSTDANEPDDRLILSYFFCRRHRDTNSATVVLRGLVYLLVEQQPELFPYLEKKYNAVKTKLYEGSMAWHNLCDVWTDMLNALRPRKVCFVVNTLDQCTEELPKLMDLITQNTALSTVKWIISSRPNVTIRSRLERRSFVTKLDLGLGENAQHVSQAVDTFIDYTLPNIPCLSDDNTLYIRVREDLRRRSGGSFLWVSRVMKKLSGAESCDVDNVLAQIPGSLVTSYRRLLRQIEGMEEGKEAEYCSDILSSVVAAYRPLSLRELGILSGLPWNLANDLKSVARLVHMCGSLLEVRDGIVHLIHLSAREFLVEEQNWWVGMRDRDEVDRESWTWKVTSKPPRYIHTTFVERSIELIAPELRRNMFNLPVLGASTKDYSPPCLASLGVIEYSMLYWADHLSDASDDGRDYRLTPRHEHKSVRARLELLRDYNPILPFENGMVTHFLNQHLLHWLETLCATGNLLAGVAATAKISRVFFGDLRMKRLLLDANRLLRYFSPCIGRYPSQLYYSGLVFSPSTSSIRWQFSKEKPPWIIANPAVDAHWNVVPQMLEGHDGPVLFTTPFSYTRRIATISGGGIVRLWDRDSAMLLHTLNTHTQTILSADFFDGCMLLVSTSGGTVQVWDTRSGRLLRSVQANTSSVSSAAFFRHSVAFGCHDGAIRLYECDGKIGDVSSLRLLRTLRADGTVKSLAFSRDYLVSVTSNHFIRVWGVKEGDQRHTITGHTGCHFSETFSPLSVTMANEQLAAGLSDGTVRLWHIGSGESWQTLQGHEGPVLSVDFSSAGQLLASGSADKTVRLWNYTLGTLHQIFVGHTGSVLSVKFLSDDGHLSSTTEDGTVRIWDTAANPTPMSSGDHSTSSTSSTMQPEGTQATTMRETGLFGPLDQLSITGSLTDASNTDGVGEPCNVLAAGMLQEVTTKRPPAPQSNGWDFSSDGCWIMWKDRKVLWVPPEYRPVAFSRELNGLTFRCLSGRILTIGFSPDAGKSIE